MNFGTRLRTILAVATCLNTALLATDITGFNSPILDTIYKVVSIILNFVIVAIATYFNNDFTEIACKHTGAMRMEKEYAKNGTDGEDFYDDVEEEDEEEE